METGPPPNPHLLCIRRRFSDRIKAPLTLTMRRRWLRLVLLLLVGLVLASSGLSLALRAGWARRSLLTRLSAGFGRSVEVGRFGFNLLSGVRLEAESVTVADDPRFGQEYFLRAERLTASVRWLALLHGRFEFETVSLTRPSLNLVRLDDGQWNIESWLPPLRPPEATTGNAGGASAPDVPAASGALAARISRIEVDGGRINFKRDSRKLSLALVAVRGQLNQDDAAHWNIDLQADPMRAPAALQEAGTLRVRGVVGGVSARLRPADLSVTWEQASLADLSRLLAGRDYGLRGTLDAELSAKIIEETPTPAPAGGKWFIDGTIRLQGVHGWALAERAGDPNANLNIQALWTPAESHLFINRCLVETPQSRLAATVDLNWSRGFHPAAQIASSRIALADLLAWRRALLAGVADDLAVSGAVDAEGSLSGWPLHIENLSLASTGALISSGALPGSIRVGPVSTDWAGGTLRVHPITVFMPAAPVIIPSARGRAAAIPDAATSSSALRVEGSLGPLQALNELRDARYRLAVSGSARRAQDLLALARAWGWSSGSMWNAEGPVSLQLVWTGALRSGTSTVNGTIQARDLELTTTMMNQPLLISSASLELRSGQRRINLDAVQAIGARWSGSLRSPAPGAPWDFDLSADRLDTADLNAWLGAAARPNLLRRILPFTSGAAAADDARAEALDHVQASGRLRVAELLLSPLSVEHIDAQAAIKGSSLILRQTRADFYGGQLTGNFEAGLSAEPSFSFDGQFARVDLADLAAAASRPGSITGLASGNLKLAAHGTGRTALAASLEGQGGMRVREAQFGQIDAAPSVAAETVAESSSSIEGRPFAATARFRVSEGQVHFDQFQLLRPDQQMDVTGAVDFAGRLDLRVQSMPRALSTAVGPAREPDSWTVIGTLNAPRIASPPVTARNGLPFANR